MIRILRSTRPLSELINYCADKSKTDGGLLVSGVLCDPMDALSQMRLTRERYGKEGGPTAFQLIQSFNPKETDPETALMIGEELISGLFPGYEALITTHTGSGQLHNHIILNPVSVLTGRKVHFEINSERKREREFNIRLMEQHGLSPFPESPSVPRPYFSRILKREGLLTGKEKLEADTDRCISIALDAENLFDLLEQEGCRVKRTDPPLFCPDGAKSFFPLKKDGRKLTKKDFADAILRSFENDEPLFSHEEPSVPPPEEGPLHTLYDLYFRWLSAVRYVGAGGVSPYPKITYRETGQIKQYTACASYLAKTGLASLSALQEKMEELKERIAALSKERRSVLALKCFYREAFEAVDILAFYKNNPPAPNSEDRKEFDKAVKALGKRDPKALGEKRETLEKRHIALNDELKGLWRELRLLKKIGRDAPRIDELLEHPLLRQEPNREGTIGNENRTHERDHARA